MLGICVTVPIYLSYAKPLIGTDSLTRGREGEGVPHVRGDEVIEALGPTRRGASEEFCVDHVFCCSLGRKFRMIRMRLCTLALGFIAVAVFSSSAFAGGRLFGRHGNCGCSCAVPSCNDCGNCGCGGHVGLFARLKARKCSCACSCATPVVTCHGDCNCACGGHCGGLLSRIKARRHSRCGCHAPACCTPAPTCGCPAPAPCPAPTPCCNNGCGNGCDNGCNNVSYTGTVSVVNACDNCATTSDMGSVIVAPAAPPAVAPVAPAAPSAPVAPVAPASST
jgi:hypothetical protein